MKYEIKFTSAFKKDIKLAKKQGKNIEKLGNDIPLDEKNKDHCLSGNYASYRECHVEPDWLLVYKKENQTLLLFLYRLGSHSDLFK